MSHIPKNFSLMYSAAQIAEKTREMAEPITAWALKTEQSTGNDVVAVPILRGGLFFFADLVREIKTSVEVVPMRTAVYEDGINQSKSTQEFSLYTRAELFL